MAISPISNPEAFDRVKFGGVECPLLLFPDGVSGFDRETTWDVKKGKGTKGAIYTVSELPPAEGSLKFQLWTDADFEAWDTFRAKLDWDPTKKSKAAVDIYHPILAANKVKSVVVKKIGAIVNEDPGKKMWSVTIDLIEYLPPPKKTVVNTPKGSSGKSSKDVNPNEDPVEARLQKQIGELLEEAKKP